MRRKLVQSACVDTARNNDIYDMFALSNEAAREHFNAINDDIGALRNSSNDHNAQLDRTAGPRAAASCSADSQTSHPSSSD